MIISTDAIVSYDEPVDYGIHKFCEMCQVCVNRCPGRALVKEKVFWRGVEKHKLMYDRCRPVMATYEGCGVCMLVCPVQRYGMAPVMEHFVETGEVWVREQITWKDTKSEVRVTTDRVNYRPLVGNFLRFLMGLKMNGCSRNLNKK